MKSTEQSERGLAVGEILRIFGLLLVLLFLLNYLNILPLSSMFPGQFGFLPHLSQKIATQKLQTKTISLPCPLPEESCQVTKIFSSKNPPMTILGYLNARDNVPLIANMAGDIKLGTLAFPNSSVNYFTITNKELKLEEAYFFAFGNKLVLPKNKTSVKQGEIIAYLSNHYLLFSTPFDGIYNLTVRFRNSNNGKFFEPSVLNDGKSINLLQNNENN